VNVTIKAVFQRTGVMAIVKALIAASDQVYWVVKGFPNPAPQSIKRRVIKAYFDRHHLDYFVETGTYTGDTLALFETLAAHCTSIELSPEYAARAKQRFAKAKNVEVLEGNSGTLISQVLVSLTHPALFWLDGHYSGGATAGVEKHTPINEELKAILSHDVIEHVILIDDARCFDGTNNYPKLEDLLAEIRQNGQYNFEISMDIIRLTPKSQRPKVGKLEKQC
jgi:hypothetical protein